MGLAKNVLAGLLNAVWTAVANLVAIPFYIHFLGIEAYGLVGFMLTLQTVLLVFDLGLGPSLNREVARLDAQQSIGSAGSLLHTLAIGYWATACALAISIALLAEPISQHWLKAQGLSKDSIRESIILIGIIIGCRWPSSIYQGTLIGAQKLVRCSVISTLAVTANTLGGITLLALVSPSIQTLFSWYAAIALIHTCILRRMAWQALGSPQRVTKKKLPRDFWKFSFGIMGITSTGLLISQMDKLFLSKLIDLKQFGQYMLAATITGSLYMLITPIFNALYPRFSALIARQKTTELATLYHLSSRMLASVLFPLALMLILFGKPIIEVWTGDIALAHSVAPVVALLAGGVMLNGVMHIPYALQLGYGATRIPLTINLILLVALPCLLLLLTPNLGSIGAAIAWLCVQSAYLVIGSIATHHFLMPGHGARWIGYSLGLPAILTILIGWVASTVYNNYTFSLAGQLALAASAGAFTSISCIVLSPELRKAIIGICTHTFNQLLISRNAHD